MKLYEFRHPEAQLFADLVVVREGVFRANQFIQPLCSATFANLSAEATEMHWTTALIRYARVFPYGGGVLKWDADGAIARLDSKDQATHRYSIDVRSGHLAHSVGDYEDSTPTVQVEGEGAEWEVVGIGSNLRRTCGPGSVEADNFSRLTENLHAIVEDMMRCERDRLQPIAQALGPTFFSGEPGVFKPDASKRKPRKPRARFG